VAQHRRLGCSGRTTAEIERGEIIGVCDGQGLIVRIRQQVLIVETGGACDRDHRP
jgi:hypothetical protein